MVGSETVVSEVRWLVGDDIGSLGAGSFGPTDVAHRLRREGTERNGNRRTEERHRDNGRTRKRYPEREYQRAKSSGSTHGFWSSEEGGVSKPLEGPSPSAERPPLLTSLTRPTPPPFDHSPLSLINPFLPSLTALGRTGMESKGSLMYINHQPPTPSFFSYSWTGRTSGTRWGSPKPLPIPCPSPVRPVK